MLLLVLEVYYLILFSDINAATYDNGIGNNLLLLISHTISNKSHALKVLSSVHRAI